MSAEAWAAVSSIAAALIAAVVTVITLLLNRGKDEGDDTPDDPSTPATRPAESELTVSQAWRLANGGLAAEVARLGGRVAELEQADAAKSATIAEQARKIHDLETEIVRLRLIKVMLPLAFRYIRDLIAWGLAGGGVEPPPPPFGLVIPDDPQPADLDDTEHIL